MASGPPAGRLAIIDVARGVAIVAMVLYHATLDLGPAFYGIIDVHAATDPYLRWFARLTAGSFLVLVGIGLVLAHRKGIRWPRFLRRLGIIVLAAAAVTVATRIFVPAEYVRFGILHCIALASVVGLLFLRVPIVVVIVAAALAFAAPGFLRADFFNSPALLWVGLSTQLPPMFDYVPMLPWLGAALIGIAAARIGLLLRLDVKWSRWQPAAFVPRALVWAGRWCIVIYLVHQLILLGPYFVLVALGRAPPFF
ncbi:MAG: heparan-alpha-glucosaminide N-acetyltransferase [Bauldia sp.]